MIFFKEVNNTINKDLFPLSSWFGFITIIVINFPSMHGGSIILSEYRLSLTINCQLQRKISISITLLKLNVYSFIIFNVKFIECQSGQILHNSKEELIFESFQLY